MKNEMIVRWSGVSIIRQKNLNDKLSEKGYYFVKDKNVAERRAKLVRFCYDGPDEVIMEIEPLKDISSVSVVMTQDYESTVYIKCHRVYAKYREEKIPGEEGIREVFYLSTDNNADVMVIVL